MSSLISVKQSDIVFLALHMDRNGEDGKVQANVLTFAHQVYRNRLFPPQAPLLWIR